MLQKVQAGKQEVGGRPRAIFFLSAKVLCSFSYFGFRPKITYFVIVFIFIPRLYTT